MASPGRPWDGNFTSNYEISPGSDTQKWYDL